MKCVSGNLIWCVVFSFLLINVCILKRSFTDSIAFISYYFLVLIYLELSDGIGFQSRVINKKLGNIEIFIFNFNKKINHQLKLD